MERIFPLVCVGLTIVYLVGLIEGGIKVKVEIEVEIPDGKYCEAGGERQCQFWSYDDWGNEEWCYLFECFLHQKKCKECLELSKVDKNLDNMSE